MNTTVYFALLYRSVVSYVPTVLQEKALVELQEEASSSPPGMELELPFDLRPRVPLWSLS